MNEKKRMKKNFLWNVVGSTLNGFNSLFFMIIITRINGVNDAGDFTLLFSLACLFCTIGTYEGRTYQVSDRSGINTDEDYMAQRYITCVLLIAASMTYALVMHYNGYQTALLLVLSLLKATEAFSDILYGFMQKDEKLYLAGMSTTLKTIVGLIVFLTLDLITHQILFSFIVVVVIWLIVLIVFDRPKSGKSLLPTFNWSGIRRLFRRGFYSFAFLFMGMYLANATKYALDGRVDSAAQAMYGIVLMPATLINLCCLYILQPYINRLSGLYGKGQYKEFRKAVKNIFGGIGLLAIAAFIVASTFGIPALGWLYGVDLSGYTGSLQLIALGASMNAAITLLSTALTIMYKTKIQFVIYLFISIFAFILSPILIDMMGVYGAAVSYIIIMAVQLIIFIIYYEYECKTGKIK